MLQREQHALVRKCFVDFYKRGGALIRLQHGRTMYFPRAVILAIFADAPAATKCTLTGSACPVCYVPQRQMSEENIVGASVKRNAASNARRKSQLLNMRRVLSADKMNERAASMGISLHMDNAWGIENEPPGEWVFGPDRNLDCVWQGMFPSCWTSSWLQQLAPAAGPAAGSSSKCELVGQVVRICHWIQRLGPAAGSSCCFQLLDQLLDQQLELVFLCCVTY